MPGTTADTNLGLFIVATNSAAGADALGVLRGIHDYSVVGDSAIGGTAYVWGDVELCDAYKMAWAEYDQSDTLAVASCSSTALGITSAESNTDGSWFYAVSGTGVGKLAYTTAQSTNAVTTKTAMGFSTDTTLIKILRLGHQVVKLNTGATKIGTDAGAGSWTVVVLENWFKAQGYNLQQLDPTKHDNVTLTKPRFWSKLLVRNTAGHTTE
jgi:hypothetical protein